MQTTNCQSKLTNQPQLYDILIQKPLTIVPASVRQLQALVAQLASLSEQKKDGHIWEVVASPLTPPEEAGIVSTHLSRALHSLLSRQETTHLLIPSAASESLTFPSPEAYKETLQHYVVGQTASLTQVVESLVQAGYVRHRSMLEPGSFKVRGEAVDISHPTLTHIFTLTFHRDTLESITVTHDRRQTILKRLTLPPMKFPDRRVSLQEFLATTDGQTIDIPPFLLPQAPATSASPISRDRAVELLSSLEPDKPAVHADHGIGIYEGLQRKHVEGFEREYLVLQYAQGDLLYVPVEFAHKVTPYLGETAPMVHRLGGTLWAKTKRRAQEEAAAFAKELLAVAGKRSEAAREPYILEPRIEEELSHSFPFALTPDQARTWQEVKQDLENSRPMDRVIVGDVGFGKTEIAIRAARHAAARGRQVAVIAPTTVLVQQHVDTFRARLRELAPQIGVLSRFTPGREVRQTIRQIEDGTLQIVVGTQALLSSRIVWKNLSFVIIDEEQKFGVRQKEHFKKIRAHVDMLSLSATPIPRTLAIALSGLRDLSLIQTAPEGRHSIVTHVAGRSDKLVKEALTQELSRGGQIYVVASKIRHLSAIREQLRALVPTARLAIAHGRLSPKKLAETIHAFDTGEVDILISSNIVENGLDLPNVNTMIVWNATDFGLADLYQLRGRVGRRSRQGYAYFLYHQAELTSVQRERLTALTEASRLGEGWSIARRDLEIRGAGNLLGKEQSGTANEVGVQLYLDLVSHATQELSPDVTPAAAGAAKSEAREPRDFQITLPLTALLPITYIPATADRARWYQRLSRARSPEQLSAYRAELERVFGPLPDAAKNLLLQLNLQHMAEKRGVTKIDSRKISPPSEDPFYRLHIHAEPAEVPRLAHKLGALGNWNSKGNILSWNVEAITPELIQNLTTALA